MAIQNIQMMIALDDVAPPIWRRFIVSDSISLHKFHQMIQTIMGWTDTHLYSFTINNIDYLVPDKENDMLFDDLLFGPPPMNSKRIKLSELNLKPRQKIKYIYDFGDNWEHTIVIEKIMDVDNTIKIPLCIDGKRNNPPEDCGSIPGYERILEVLKKKKLSDEDKELIEWLGNDFNPELFDLNDINMALHPKRNRKPKLKLYESANID